VTVAGNRRDSVMVATDTVALPGERLRVESLYEAGFSASRRCVRTGWADAIASGTQIEVEVREPATMHCVTVAQLRRWCEGVCVSPDETLRKKKLKQLLT